MVNMDIRRAAAGAGLKLWQIADKLGIADSSLSQKFRKELSSTDREKILAIINELAKEAQ